MKVNKIILIKKVKAFSLIELLIAIAIVGILASIVYPSYSAFITRTNRTEAQRELLRLANVQEQYYVNEGEYASNMTLLGFESSEYETTSGNYGIYVSKSSKTSFTLSAKAKGSQYSNDTKCGVISINEVGQRSGFSVNCWE